jgi:hypothetical protein
MKSKLDNITRATLVSILIGFLGACAPLEGASTTKSISLDEWAASYIDKGEKLLCKREENGEYFFLAQEVTGDRVKVGSLIDMSSYRNQTHAFIVAWKFRNEKGNPLVAQVRPSAVQEAYVKDGGKTYAENVQYQTLNLKDSKKMQVTIDIKKCPTADCDRQQTKSKDEKEYSIKLCEIPLNKQ